MAAWSLGMPGQRQTLVWLGTSMPPTYNRGFSPRLNTGKGRGERGWRAEELGSSTHVCTISYLGLGLPSRSVVGRAPETGREALGSPVLHMGQLPESLSLLRTWLSSLSPCGLFPCWNLRKSALEKEKGTLYVECWLFLCVCVYVCACTSLRACVFT